jgi:hypothetical protein
MTEEQNVPKPAPVCGRPPMPWGDRVATMSTRTLEGECRKISRSNRNINGALADVLLICFFKKPISIDDPYTLRKRTRKAGGFDMWKSMKGV